MLEINSCCGCLSTGRIAVDIAKDFLEENITNRVVVAYARSFRETGIETYKIGSKVDVMIHKGMAYLFDCDGFCSYKSTKRFLKWADTYNPDIVWLHNIHGFYINVELLFKWIKSRPQMKVMWTLHDCWPFTGHCTFFTMTGCNKWMEGCENCKFEREYPPCIFLNKSSKNYKRKRELFTGVKNMTIITPSKWLADLVKESFLKEYRVIVKHNTIDKTVFRPTYGSFVKDNGLEGKKIVLGVASPWSNRKGLNDFVKLDSILDDSYKIVLVGIDEQKRKRLPNNILSIPRTDSREQLAEIYSAATVFVNPTYEDNYPTTNLEAEACGTIVVTYNTGGSPESVKPENVIEKGNIYDLAKRIIEICEIQ